MSKEENLYSNPIKAIWNGLIAKNKVQAEISGLNAEDHIYGKTCLVTGANSGLGFAIAQGLAERGARVIMACRSGIPEAGKALRIASKSESIEMLPLDLSDLQSVHFFCDYLKQKNEKIDIFVSNAAMVAKSGRKSKDGFDEMFQVNYLSKFLLIHRLLRDERFQNTDPNFKPRIIIVSSESHRSPTEIDWESFGQFKDYGLGKSMFYYGYYKLFLTLFAQELSRRLDPSIAVHSLCPGPVNSNIAREAPAWSKPMLRGIFKLFFQSPQKAAQAALYLAMSPQLEGQTGEYLHMRQIKAVDEKAASVENGKKLWQKSAVLLKTQF